MHISRFLKIIFNKFKNSNIKYCILRNYESLPQRNKNRDIDILVNDFDIKKIIKFLNKNFTITSFNERDYICSVFISGITDGKKDSLMLDFQTKLSWKGISYLDNEKVFKSSIKYKNNKLMNIPSSAHQALITFFSFYLLGGDLNICLKKKHKDQFKKNKSNLITLISSISNYEFSNRLYIYVTLGNINKLKKLLYHLRIKLFISNFKKHSFNIFLKIIRHHIFEIRIKFTPYPLKHISFLGLDGSGKSSLINNISKGIGERIYNVRKEHLKPSLFTGQAGKKVARPHLMKPRNNFISIIKLFYWIYAYNYKNYNHRLGETTLILWDRYIDDISIDPLRYRLNLKRKTYDFFINLVPKPECTFIVDVPAKLAFKRKRELTVSILNDLRKKYLEKGKKNKNTFVIDNSKNLNDVTKKTIKIITKVLNQKTKKQINFFLKK